MVTNVPERVSWDAQLHHAWHLLRMGGYVARQGRHDASVVTIITIKNLKKQRDWPLYHPY
jgi:hypothetical protein